MPSYSVPLAVYPRVYGGTGVGSVPDHDDAGLSPRVRGNLSLALRADTRIRSIPACTGEPAPGPCPRLLLVVYPRVYGGTPPAGSDMFTPYGLSPRVRGNLLNGAPRCGQQRSIPACTGEPAGQAGPALRPEVYPRVYGGTGVPLFNDLPHYGLSPRVRGNRRTPTSNRTASRSIPACTGEPLRTLHVHR